MDRSDLMDKLEEIQNKNYNRFKGVNEADLATREDIADLFEKLLSEAREGKEPINDAPAGGLSKHDVNQQRKLLLAFCDHLNTYAGMEEIRFDFMMQDFLDKSQ